MGHCGKRFALVRAGNPYTETREVFRIPDMLANRADVYNLGDVLSGREALFGDSYIENALTANPVAAPLAERPRAEIRSVLRIARGDDEPLPTGLPGGGVELVEIVKRMVAVRDVLGRVNAACVASAGSRHLAASALGTHRTRHADGARGGGQEGGLSAPDS